MNEFEVILNAFEEEFTDEEFGILMKQSDNQKEITETINKKLSPELYAKVSKLNTKAGKKLQELIEEGFDEDDFVSLFLIETFKLALTVMSEIKNLERYDEYKSIAKTVYHEYNLDYDKVDMATDKLLSTMTNKDNIKKLIEVLQKAS